MKYMLLGTYRAHPLTRVTLACTLVFLGGFWITNGLLYFRSMDLRSQSVVEYYRGSEEEFAMPRTYGSMLEVTHMHLGSMAVVLLLLTHLAIFLPWSLRLRIVLVLVTFGCGLLGEAASWLVRFVQPGFAWLKVAAFLGLEASLAVLLVGVGWQLLQRPERAAEALPANGAREARAQRWQPGQ